MQYLTLKEKLHGRKFKTEVILTEQSILKNFPKTASLLVLKSRFNDEIVAHHLVEGTLGKKKKIFFFSVNIFYNFLRLVFKKRTYYKIYKYYKM